MNFLIWSFKHSQWWAPNECGYVADIEQAGRYSQVEAGRIVTNSVFNESIAVCQPVANENGPPRFHPYQGEMPSAETDN